MVRTAMLHHTTDRITAYIQQYVTLAGAEKREEVLELFDKTQKLFPQWVIMTCPIMHPDIHYISNNSDSVFGNANLYGDFNTNVEGYFNQVHDADQEDLHSCFTFTHDFLEAIPADDHPYYRVVLHYRFKKANEQYIYLHDEKAVLSLQDSGNLYYALIRDITADKNFNGVKAEVFRQDQTLTKVTEYKPSAERGGLTKREGELVALIKQGLSTKEIAWYLKISHNTVRNIKSKLFEKYNVNNTVELLNMTA